MVQKWTADRIKSKFKEINQLLGLNVSCELEVAEKGKFPFWRGNKKDLFFAENFFNHCLLTESERLLLLAEMYSCTYLDKKKDGFLPITPDLMAKGICCDLLHIDFIDPHELEPKFRIIRKELYSEPEYYSFFSLGETIRGRGLSESVITDIAQDEKKNILITLKPTKDDLGVTEQNIIYSEEELYDRVVNRRNRLPGVTNDTLVDLSKRNIFVLSAPSGTGKNTVYSMLKEKLPNIQRAITCTTRLPRAGEIEGIDYFFISCDEFYNKMYADEFAEHTLYDEEFYATPVSEIYKYPDDTPLFMIVDTSGMYQAMCRFPLITSVFLMPPSIDVLEKRIRERGQNSPESIEKRIAKAKDEIKESKKYDYIIVNDDLNECVDKVLEIVKKQIASM